MYTEVPAEILARQRWCDECEKLVSVGCSNRMQCYCTHFRQIIARPDITSCSREENEDDSR